ncbi:hypothetical protein [Aurantimonas sp. HBX-1]|uniref:hypothetical protein n=1 Tax=Aurantimonas sp. HBX-1 TaxID=2906072 RepID=UPI001F3BBF81|nr:hypothetical protein [Aurantimonas sp. HBX-1]UIJ72610.1 hypothetical protein LXB15_02810 [Aurantimonas sp. HBX-1]
MIRILATSAVALVLFASTMASAQYVPGSDATSRANGFAERQRVAAGYPDAAARATVRPTTYGYATAARPAATVPGSEYARKRSEEAARASVVRPTDVTGF